jgi:hypothetical protein
MSCLRVPSATTSRWTANQSVLGLVIESARSQIKDQAAVHLWVEREVEVIQSIFWITENGMFAATLRQPIAAPA